ncbi:MAG: phosphoglycerate dehydrogenase [Patescibacteria group bacterium]
MQKKYFIIDFDSTFVKSEGLEELARIALKNNPKKNEIYEKIKTITNLGLEGKLSFGKSLSQRLKLFKGTKKDVQTVAHLFKRKTTLSIKRNKRFFKTYKDSIYIVSGGFKEFIIPVMKAFKIPNSNIFANTFIYDKAGNIIGYDRRNPLAQDNGKYNAVQLLNLKGEVYIIGDGYTDYQIKQLGAAKYFIAFTENVTRKSVIKEADQIAPNFDEFLYANKLDASLSYPKNRIKVLLLENINQEAVKAFEKEGYPVEYYGKTLPHDELMEKIKNISVLCIRSRTKINEELLKKARHLISLGAFCIGTNQVNLSEASQKGIAIFNAPYSNTRSVVELMIGEIIFLMRNIIDKNNLLHKGIWDKSTVNSHEIRGKTLGIIGYGNIGSQLSVLAESLGMQVLFYDKAEKLALGNAKKCLSLKEALKNSDVISVHIGGNSDNQNFIGEKEFRLMKPGVIFLNASRGFVVDLQALSKYIREGKIGGAAVDVFPNEPKNKGNQFISELQNLPNVILTPHIGGSTEEAQKNIGEFVSHKIIDYINTGNTMLSVNFPNVQLPVLHNSHRLLHIHKNVPGILAQINNILAKNNINIEGQYLKTNEEIGYVITDINKRHNHSFLVELKNIRDTIRSRILY